MGGAIRLTGTPTIPAEMLGAMDDPAVLLGVQVALKRADGTPARVVLDIDDIIVAPINY